MAIQSRVYDTCLKEDSVACARRFCEASHHGEMLQRPLKRAFRENHQRPNQLHVKASAQPPGQDFQLRYQEDLLQG